MGKRDKDDKEWQNVKKFVFERDKNKCRFMSIIPAKDASKIRKIAPSTMLRVLDPAHVIAVGVCSHLVYEPRNIVTLCRWVHECLDNCKSPITGNMISKEERDSYWIKIVGSVTYGTLQELKKPKYLTKDKEVESNE